MSSRWTLEGKRKITLQGNPLIPPYQGEDHYSIVLEYSASYSGNAVLAPRLVGIAD